MGAFTAHLLRPSVKSVQSVAKKLRGAVSSAYFEQRGQYETTTVSANHPDLLCRNRIGGGCVHLARSDPKGAILYSIPPADRGNLDALHAGVILPAAPACVWRLPPVDMV